MQARSPPAATARDHRPQPPQPARCRRSRPPVPGGLAAAGAGGGAEPAAAAQEGKFSGAGAAGAGGAARGAPQGEWGAVRGQQGVARRYDLRSPAATSGQLWQPGRMVRRPASRCPARWSCEQPGWRLGAAGLGLLGPGRARRLQGGARDAGRCSGTVLADATPGVTLASPTFLVASSC